MLVLGHNLYNLKEFGVQTIRHRCPSALGRPLSAEKVSPSAGTHVAKTLSLPEFNTCPPGPLDFKVLWALIRALAAV